MLSLFCGSFILDGIYLIVVVTFLSLSSSLVVALLVAKITGGGVVIVFGSSFPSLLLLSLVLWSLWSSSSSGSLLCGSVMSTDPSLLTLLLLVVLVVSLLVVSLLVESLFVESLLVVFVLCEVVEVFVVCGCVGEEVVVEHWHVVAASVDLRIDLRRTVSVGDVVDEVDVEEVDVVGVSLSRIEESVFVQSDSVIEHPGDSGAVELS